MKCDSSVVRWIAFAAIGAVIVAVRILFAPAWDSFWEKCLDSDIVPLVICLALLVLLLGYYFEKNEHKPMKGSTMFQIGHDLSKVIAWCLSINGLFVLLVLTVIALVLFIITNVKNAADNNGVLQLLTITLTVTLSALIPTMISRIVAKNQLNDIIEQKLEIELLKYKTSLNSIRKDKGHASRMSAVLLEQMAGSRQENQKQLCQDNAAWSIGWAADAIIQYVLIQETYPNALKNSAFCFNVINKAANHIEVKNNLVQSNIKLKDLRSLITMHSLIQQYHLNDILLTMAIEQRQSEKHEDLDGTGKLLEYRVSDTRLELGELLRVIEKAFYNKLSDKEKSFDSSGFCTITGMSQEFNDELNRYAISVINEMIDDGSKKNNQWHSTVSS